VPKRRRFRHSIPRLSSISDAWGRLNVVTPFHHLSGGSHLHRSLGAGPITASRTRAGWGFVLTHALSPHRAKILPLVHDAAIGKSAHAVLAARTVTDLGLPAALGAEHRRRIGKRPGALRGRK